MRYKEALSIRRLTAGPPRIKLMTLPLALLFHFHRLHHSEAPVLLAKLDRIIHHPRDQSHDVTLLIKNELRALSVRRKKEGGRWRVT